jgi:hypothetical protein
MPETARSVLRVNSVEEQGRYRSAISRIITNIMRDNDVTMMEIADRIDVSVGTISNAANKKTDLQAVYLKRLGEAYGPHQLDPYAALTGGRMVPINAKDIDALPPLTASIHRLAVAQSPGSEGGQTITHRELLGMLPELREAQQALTSLIARADVLAA